MNDLLTTYNEYYKVLPFSFLETLLCLSFMKTGCCNKKTIVRPITRAKTTHLETDDHTVPTISVEQK